MNKLNFSPFKKLWLASFLILTISYLSFLSCASQTQNSQISIPPLEKIDQKAQAHYESLKKYSTTPEESRKELDALAFPNKAHQLTIKLFSPAYLSREEINEQILKLEHPSNSSEQTRAELDFLLKLQNERTKEQVEEALEMHDIVYFPLIGMRDQGDLFYEAYEIFGDQFKPEEYPKTQKLLNNIMKEMRITEFTAKNHFLRARPRQLESKLQPLKKMKTSSFASGHTLWAYMQAYLMAALVPEKRTEFIDLAYRIGFSREVLGVHYPSDEEASRKLAHNLLSEMWSKPKFAFDFQEAQKEWGTKPEN